MTFMTTIEKDFFKIITGMDYDETRHKWKENQLYFDEAKESAQSCARKFEEGIRDAYEQGYKNRHRIDNGENKTFTDYLKSIKE